MDGAGTKSEERNVPGSQQPKQKQRVGRRACENCRRSHVHCDEVRPMCGRCSKISVKKFCECVYLSPEEIADARAQAAAARADAAKQSLLKRRRPRAEEHSNSSNIGGQHVDSPGWNNGTDMWPTVNTSQIQHFTAGTQAYLPQQIQDHPSMQVLERLHQLQKVQQLQQLRQLHQLQHLKELQQIQQMHEMQQLQQLQHLISPTVTSDFGPEPILTQVEALRGNVQPQRISSYDAAQVLAQAAQNHSASDNQTEAEPHEWKTIHATTSHMNRSAQIDTVGKGTERTGLKRPRLGDGIERDNNTYPLSWARHHMAASSGASSDNTAPFVMGAADVTDTAPPRLLSSNSSFSSPGSASWTLLSSPLSQSSMPPFVGPRMLPRVGTGFLTPQQLHQLEQLHLLQQLSQLEQTQLHLLLRRQDNSLAIPNAVDQKRSSDSTQLTSGTIAPSLQQTRSDTAFLPRT